MGNKKYFFLYPFAVLYGLITDIRNYLYDKGIIKSVEFNIPVICLGNITVGGTGKTPHTEYIINLLRKKYKIAVLSRGYKRKSKGFRLAVSGSTVSEIGDEPLQISRKFPEIIVAVDEDRTRGIRTLEKNYPETDVIILDDGFQHRKVKPGLSILLTDFNRLVTRDSLMPYGRLRESRRNRRRADIIIISKSPGYIPEIKRQEITSELKSTRSQKLFFTTVQYGSLRPLFNRPVHPHNILSMPGKEKTGIVLITGIANPLPLYTYLENNFRKIVRLDFPDHHYYRQSDINKIRKSFDELGTPEKIVITTEKDAVRLREITNIEDSLKEVFYYIPVEIGFMENTSYEFDNMIIEYVGKNKRDS